jgi:hypothetical protein
LEVSVEVGRLLGMDEKVDEMLEVEVDVDELKVRLRKCLEEGK